MVEHYMETACHAAMSAGTMIRSETQTPYQIRRKAGFDFVTEVDRKSEELIRQSILSAYPDHDFFGEEQVSSSATDEDELLRRTGEYTWVVDALDGTTNFIRGIPQFSISIALIHGGDILAGAVYDPSRDEMFSAYRGGGAWLNGRKIHVSHVDRLQDAVVSFGFPAVDMEKRRQTMSLFSAVCPHVGSARIYNCAALLLCYTACGRIDLTFEMGIHLWDMAAGLLIIQEAGGITRRTDGSPLDLFSKENLAGPQPLVDAFLQLTRGPVSR